MLHIHSYWFLKHGIRKSDDKRFGLRSLPGYFRGLLYQTFGEKINSKAIDDYIHANPGTESLGDDSNFSGVELAKRKYLNVFKWIEFVLALSLQGVTLIANMVLAVLLAIPMVISFLVNISMVEDEGYKKIPQTKEGRYTLLVLGAIFAGLFHFLVFTVLDLVAFVFNCLLCPTDTLIRPIRDFIEDLVKSDEESGIMRNISFGLFVLACILLVGMVVVSLVFSGGTAAFPAGLGILSSLMASVTALASIGLNLMAGVMGMVASKVVLGIALSLVSIGVCHRLATLECLDQLKVRFFDALTIGIWPRDKDPVMNEVGTKKETDCYTDNGVNPLKNGRGNALSRLYHNTPKAEEVYSTEQMAEINRGGWKGLVYATAESIGAGPEVRDVVSSPESGGFISV